MPAIKLPSLHVCEIAHAINALSPDDRHDLFSLVAQASDLDLTVEKIEQTIEHEGDIGRAAIALGCSRRTLQLHMRKLGMPKSRGGRPKGPLHAVSK